MLAALIVLSLVVLALLLIGVWLIRADLAHERELQKWMALDQAEYEAQVQRELLSHP